MFTLLGEINLWTFEDNIIIKDTDFGAFRYHDRRFEGLQEDGKRSYCQKRGMMYIPNNRKGNKLKDSIKYLEEQLRDNSAMYYKWYNHCIVQVMLSNGLLIQIQVNNITGDVEKIMFDKYFIGKVCDHITDATITKNHLICTYNDQQVTVAYFAKTKQHVFDKFSKLEPKVATTDLFGLNGRRLDKKIQVNKTEDLILIWWKSATNEVYPWSPAAKEHDRANMFLYHLEGIRLQLVCYIRTEFDPLCITFDVCHGNIIHSVEQKVSRKGEVTIEWRTYEVSDQDKLQRIGVISIFLPTHTSCICFSPNQELLLLCCIDGSVILYDQTKASNNTIKTAFIPTLASWHSDGFIFAIGNDRGQFQHFDISLSCVKSQILNEDAMPANILDLSPYFRNQPALLQMEWNTKCYSKSQVNSYNYGGALFLLLFERGPLGVIKIIEGNNLSGDVLIKRYLSLSQIDQATSLLLAMNWDTHPCICMHALNQILNYLFKLPLTTKCEHLIQNALGSFHVPIRPISQAIEVEYGDEVRDLTRRFFHHLLRYRLFEKAFRLAIDLNDHDLFMDVHFYALVVNDTEMANAAKEKAEHILSRSNSCSSSHSGCSRTSCSTCSDSISDKGDESYSEKSDNSTKEKDNSYKQMRRHPYASKSPSIQIPPLPVLRPNHSTQNLLPVSVNSDTLFNKVDCNLMSTSFNVPSNTHVPIAFDHSSHISISNTFFASTSFNKPTCKTHSTVSMSTSTISMTSNSKFTSDTSDDLMTTSFGNFAINESVLGNQDSNTFTEKKYNKSLRNVISHPFNDTCAETTIENSGEMNKVLSVPFNDFLYESVDVKSSKEVATSFDYMGSSIESTSFGTVIPTMLATSNNFTNSVPSLKTPTNILMSTLGTKNTCNATVSFTSEKITDSSTDHFILCNTSSNNTTLKCPRIHKAINSNESSTKNINIKDQSKDRYQSISNKNWVDIDVPPPSSLTMKSGKRILQRQDSLSSILHNQENHIDTLRSSNYALNYDFNYIPHHGSCNNIDKQYHNSHSMKYTSVGTLQNICSYNLEDKKIDTEQLKLGPSTTHISVKMGKDFKLSSNIPPLPVLTASTHTTKSCPPCPAFVDAISTCNEKPKVKFSDTVTHILVPGTNQTHRQKRTAISQLNVTDPRRELAESLPLCLGNEDYLKDFQPLSKDDGIDKTKRLLRSDEGAKIKVVHFGLL